MSKPEKHGSFDAACGHAREGHGMNPASKQAYIVWNEARTEGYVTFDKQVAYEARKGAESNCFDSNGTQMHLAQAFCEVTGIQNCTVQKIEIASVFDPEDFHRS